MDEFAEFQQKYAVKQSEIERTKKIANYCGLDFPTPHRRPTADHVPAKSKSESE